jgi:penicillin amidase
MVRLSRSAAKPVRGAGRVRTGANLALAALVSLVVMALLASGTGAIPPLGAALDPGGGVWSPAADAMPIGSASIELAGMHAAATVSFDSGGVPTVHAASDEDLYLVEGYLQAYFRLTQLDMERRTAEGTLSQLDGPSQVASDTFELQTGLLRTAQATWAATPPGSTEASALDAFSRGVDDRLAQLRASGDWPSVFTLTGVYPATWTPVDSLAVQGLLSQVLSFTNQPLDYDLLDRSLGAKLTQEFFPVDPADAQDPYDPGPYTYQGVDPLPADGNADAAPLPTGTGAGAGSPATGSPATGSPATGSPATGSPATGSPATDSSATRSSDAGSSAADFSDAAYTPPATGTSTAHTTSTASSADSASAASADSASAGSSSAALLARVAQLPASEIHTYPDSNSWVANGPEVAGGDSLLAGDPHLQLSLPSFWYQTALSSPETAASGASLVGLPGIVVGRNASISWSMTAVQNQSTLFYAEKTSPSRPNQYYWDGAWRNMQVLHYSIPVRGAATVPLTVDLTVHGPVMAENGETVSVTWMGDYPSQSLAAILAVDKASDYQQFRGALANWHAPTLNFSYADGHGNIGVVAAGYFPVVKAGQPWLPLSGTGADDLAGVIPYSAAPQAYDPPNHVLATTNQRPVAADYPYYIGTSLYFDNGYRADEISSTLEGRTGQTAADFGALQDNVTDYLSTLIVPKLEQALGGAALSTTQRQALAELSSWNHRMTTGSAGASIWWTFWTDYLSEVFQPWWTATKVPVAGNSGSSLAVSSSLFSLDEDLEAWTLHDPDAAAFSPPGHDGTGTATTAMRAAFAQAVTDLGKQLGSSPAQWTWGRLHTTEIPSISGTDGLGYGPYPSGGDPWTVDAAEGGMDSSFGPSWRMIVDWTGPGTASAQAIYPGGQSENPASPWYQNFVSDWWNGTLLPMPWVDGPTRSGVRWTLRAGA